MKKAVSRGFTIVELLIVIVVIGILAAITIVAYNGVQTRAHTAAVQSDLTSAKKQLLLAQVDAGTFPADTTSLKASGGTTYELTVNNTANPQTFCLTGTNSKISYKITESTSATQGSCPGHGSNGVAAVTNLVPNPSVESDLTDLSASSSSIARSNLWASSGSYSVALTPTGASTDTFIPVGGNQGGMRLGMQAGKTYTLSAVLHIPAALTGTLDPNRALRITAWQNNGAYNFTSAAAPNTPGTYPLKLTFTLASNATEAFIRLYDGGSSGSGTIYYDSIMLTEGSTSYSYADGNSPNWVWNGTINNSTSTGPGV